MCIVSKENLCCSRKGFPDTEISALNSKIGLAISQLVLRSVMNLNEEARS